MCLAEWRASVPHMIVPEDLRYSSDHEWARLEGDRVRIGITDYAQDALGDVVYFEVPTEGAAVNAGERICEVESTKSVSDIYAPVAGTVVEVNHALADSPERLNQDPYGDGWICVIEVAAGAAALDGMMDAAGYRELTAG
jgi:glycine cleavage system H protein